MKLPDIRALIEAATPGPWVKSNELGSDSIGPVSGNYAGADASEEDIRFILASRDLLPKLLAVAEAAEARRDQECDCDAGGKCSACYRTDALISEALAALESE